VTLAVTGSSISNRVFRRRRMTVFQKHRLAMTGSRWDIRWVSVVERRRLSVYFLYLAWPLWKSVVTLAVTGNNIYARVIRR
jgi:hypothetical protein